MSFRYDFLLRHSGARDSASPESITTIVSMDSGPAASGRQLPTEGAHPRCAIAHRGMTDKGGWAYFSAATSLAAFSSSTLPSSLRLAGGRSAAPLERGLPGMVS